MQCTLDSMAGRWCVRQNVATLSTCCLNIKLIRPICTFEILSFNLLKVDSSSCTEANIKPYLFLWTTMELTQLLVEVYKPITPGCCAVKQILKCWKQVRLFMYIAHSPVPGLWSKRHIKRDILPYFCCVVRYKRVIEFVEKLSFNLALSV
jgi:hypothetical protein